MMRFRRLKTAMVEGEPVEVYRGPFGLIVYRYPDAELQVVMSDCYGYGVKLSDALREWALNATEKMESVKKAIAAVEAEGCSMD